MAHVKLSLLFLLFLVVSSSSGGLIAEAFDTVSLNSEAPRLMPNSDLNNEMANLRNIYHKEGQAKKSRKLLENVVQLDYDYAGPNPKHDPRKGKGGRNL